MREKVLITGANGLLGQKLVNLFAALPDCEVVAISRGKNRNKSNRTYSYFNVDLTDFDKVAQLVSEVRPSIIINAAAMTNVDLCEERQEECDLINVEFVRCLVELCEEHSTFLIHISTDFIFDGTNGPYKEDDEPNPLSHYGMSKLRSEKIIQHSSLNYVILRTILVYGLVDKMPSDNFVLWLKNAIENKKEVTIVDDQFRMPTFVDDLAQACFLAVDKKVTGVFHISSNELMNIYEMAIEVAKTFNLDTSYIKRISTKELNQKAQRPAVTGFDLSKSTKILGLPLVSFAERLQVFKDQLSTQKSL